MEAGEHSSVSTDLLQRPLMTIQDREGADPFSLRGNLEEAGDECGLTSDVGIGFVSGAPISPPPQRLRVLQSKLATVIKIGALMVCQQLYEARP